MSKHRGPHRFDRLFLPVGLYLILFFFFSPHLLGRFSTHFFGDVGDGLQNVWNMWWVKKAVTELGHHPWRTEFLHYPSGSSLLGHTLNPFNGFMGIILQRFVTLVEAYNAMVVFSFVAGGWTAFLLCLELTGSYWGAVAGGSMFTFSSYHFMHAEGHMQLVSVEWLPLFLLLWHRFIEKPSHRQAIGAPLALFLVILCDYYYFLYAIMGSVFLLAWSRIKAPKKFLTELHPSHSGSSWLLFIATTLMTSGVLIGALFHQNHLDPLLGAHSADDFSMDLLAPFVPSYHWRFHEWTASIWSRWTGNGNETSVYVGWTSLILSAYSVWILKRRESSSHLLPWIWMGLTFFVFSLGPWLHVSGHELRSGTRFQIYGRAWHPLTLPYSYLVSLLPPLRLSGVPVRMMIMVQLSLAILVSASIGALLESGSRWKQCALALCCVIWAFESYPRPLPSTEPVIPPYVETLRELPDGAVIDQVSSFTWPLYYQTVFQKKIFGGYISRVPASVVRQEAILSDLIRSQQWRRIFCEWGFSYLITRDRSVSRSVTVTTIPGGADAWILAKNPQTCLGIDR